MANQLLYDPRLYDLMRQNAINNIEEALIEIVTNSHDAYSSMERVEGGENLKTSSIDITSDKETRKVVISDKAKGMTSDEMGKKLLTVGSLTADEFTRGLIGRGAKDVSNIGDLEFVGIKNNKISICKIYQNLTGEITVSDRDVTQDEREQYNILGNGMVVTITVSFITEFPEPNVLFSRMTNNYFLRKLYTDSSHPITLNGKRLVYTYPKGEEVIKINFEVPNYPEATAEFTVYKTSDIIPNPVTDLEMRYGIMVTSSQSVYECSGLYANDSLYKTDYRWNPNMKFLYGELKCDYIDKLAREISTVGKSVENPSLIFDSNRRNGLLKNHPFTISLYEIPYRWLDIVLNKIQDEKDDYLITSDSIGQMLSGIESMLSENLPIENTLYTWRSKTDQDNLNAMSKYINDIKINQDIINMDDVLLDQIKKDEEMVPIPRENENGRTAFDIKIVNNKEMKKAYEVYFYSDKVSIRINALDESVEPFVTFKENDSEIDIDGEGALVSVNRILQDAVVYMLTRRTLMSSTTPTVSTTNNYNEILEIQNDSKAQLKSYSQSVFNSIYTKFHASI